MRGQEKVCRSTPKHPGDLYPAEQMILGATRLWAHQHRQGEETSDLLTRYFQFVGCLPAMASHNALMQHCHVAGCRPIALHSVNCPCLSEDEESIVHVAAYGQRRWDTYAADLLGRWFQPAAVRLTLPAVRGLGEALASYGFCIPLRPWDVTRSRTPEPWWFQASSPTSDLTH